MLTLCLSALLFLQEKSQLAKDAERIIGEIKDGSSSDGGLFKLFGDEYIPSLEWESELVPVLLAGLKIDNHSVQFSVDRIWHKVAGFELINLGGTTFEALNAGGKVKVLERLAKWWDKVKEGSRVDWFIDALASPSAVTRRMGLERLSMLFNRALGYDPDAGQDARDRSVEDWRAWWKIAQRIVRWDAEQACYAVDDSKLSAEELQKVLDRARAWVVELGDVDVEVREKASERLIEAGRGAVEALTEALKSDDIEVRQRAQLILDAQKAVSSRKALREQVEAILKSREVADAIAELAKKRDVASATVIIEVCDRSAPAEHGLPAAKRAAQDPAIAWAFARRIRRATADVYQGQPVYYPTDAIRGLYSEGAEQLVPYLKDASPRVRMAAASMLALRGTKHLDAVKSALAATDKRVRLSAITMLGQSRDLNASAIIQEHFKGEKDWDTRRWSVLAVARLQDIAAIDWLAAIAAEGNQHVFVAGAAAEAIGILASPKGVVPLLKLLDVRKSDLDAKADDYTRRYIVSYITGALVKIALAGDDKEAWKALEDLCAHPTGEIRELTVQAVVYTDPAAGPAARVRELFQAATGDSTAKVRNLAELGLKRWKQP